jgi:hypothetical protein
MVEAGRNRIMLLADGFDPAEREDWLVLVDKIMKGATVRKAADPQTARAHRHPANLYGG